MLASFSNRHHPTLLVLYCCLLFVAGFLSFCSKDENAERDYPRLRTIEVTQIDASGALFQAEIISGNPAAIIEYGFVWSTFEDPTIEKDDKQFKSGAPAGHAFSDTIRSALKNNQVYYMRAYIKTATFLVYGKTLTFKSMGSLAPQITGFTPETATWGDTLRITGKYFGYNTKVLQVKIGAVTARIVANTDRYIDCVIPPDKNSEKVNLFVFVNGNSSMSSSQFTFLKPTFSSITPLTASYNDTLTVRGTNLSMDKSAVQLYFNEWPARTVYASSEMIRVVVPEQLTNNQTGIFIEGPASHTPFSSFFTLKDIELISFQPDTVFSDKGQITITGRNFSPLPDVNKVFINGISAKITALSAGSIKADLPSGIIPDKMVSLKTSVQVRVQRGQQSATFPVNLVIHYRTPWKRLKDFPGPSASQGIGFSINGKGYTGLGTLTYSGKLSNELWEYDPGNDQWTAKAPFPGKLRKDPSSFVIGEAAYVGLGNSRSATNQKIYHNDFYKYVPLANTWIRIADYPKMQTSSASFVIDEMAYVGTGRYGNNTDDLTNEFFRYTPLDNQWTASQPFTKRTETASGFSIDNKGYLFQGSRAYQYNQSGWEAKGETSSSFNSDGITFTIGQSAYIFNPYFWEYNSVNRTINLLDRPPIYIYGIFVIGSKAYCISTEQQVWVFDPTGKE